MRNAITTIFMTLALFFTATIQAQEVNAPEANKTLQKAYYEWIDAVTTAKGNPETVLALYDPHAILLATLKARPLKTPEDLAKYFKKFTSLKDLSATTDKLVTVSSGDFGINSGLYTFHYINDEGKPVSVNARFSFVYEKEGDKWLIINHHSSATPE